MTRAPSMPVRCLTALACGLCTALLLTGCASGFQTASSAPDLNHTVLGLGGQVYGGANPIVGATVNLYVTGTSYGAYSSQTPATAVTDSNGNFSFSPVTCPTGTQSYAYVVSAAGKPGGVTTNTSAVLVAALGRCEDLPSTGTIFMNEATTVAAAYALGHFAATSGSGASTTVGIGADATNNSPYTGSGTSSAGCVNNTHYTTAACPTTSAAGLYHAFLNAANLINVWQNDGAYARPPGNSQAIAPEALLNTIANVLITCVDSSGASSSACTQVFNSTSLPSAPTNTFRAMINLAANPTLTGATDTSISDFYNLASSTTNFFAPILSSTGLSNLHDYSLAIVYPQGLGSGTSIQGIQYAYSLGIDINDVVYIGNQNSTPTKMNIASFASNGELLSFTTDNTTYVTGWGVSPDAAGHVFSLDSADTSNTNPVLRWASTNGAVSSTATVITSDTAGGTGVGSPIHGAVDRLNNYWYTTNGTSQSLYKVVGASTTTNYYLHSATTLQGLSIDPDQNVWFTEIGASASQSYIAVFPNTGSPSSPTYTGSDSRAPLGGSAADFSLYGIAFVPQSTSYIAFVDAFTTNAGIYPVTPTFASSPTTEVSSETGGTAIATTATNMEYNDADSAGAIWSADLDGNQIVQVTTPTGTPSVAFLKPCLSTSPPGSSTCENAVGGGPRDLSIDATGSIWIASSSYGVVQIIGSAAPTWPLRSLGVLTEP